MTAGFYKRASGIIIVYDCTSQESFENVESWVQSITDNAIKNVQKILVANKVDLEHERVISREQGLELARQNELDYFEASAVKNEGVDEFFSFIIEKCLEEI